LLTTPFGRDTGSLRIESVRAPNSVLFLKRSVAGSIMAVETADHPPQPEKLCELLLLTIINSILRYLTSISHGSA